MSIPEEQLFSMVHKANLRGCYTRGEDTGLIPGKKTVFVDIQDNVGVGEKALVIPLYGEDEEEVTIGKVYANEWVVKKIVTKNDGRSKCYALAYRRTH